LSKGESKLPTEKEILEYIARKGGEVTNDEMYRERFGDVERDGKTVALMREMADFGILELKIEHNFTAHTTTIIWRIKAEDKMKDFKRASRVERKIGHWEKR